MSAQKRITGEVVLMLPKWVVDTWDLGRGLLRFLIGKRPPIRSTTWSAFRWCRSCEEYVEPRRFGQHVKRCEDNALRVEVNMMNKCEYCGTTLLPFSHFFGRRTCGSCRRFYKLRRSSQMNKTNRIIPR
jgi:hypothetical protein